MTMGKTEMMAPRLTEMADGGTYVRTAADEAELERARRTLERFREMERRFAKTRTVVTEKAGANGIRKRYIAGEDGKEGRIQD